MKRKITVIRLFVLVLCLTIPFHCAGCHADLENEHFTESSTDTETETYDPENSIVLYNVQLYDGYAVLPLCDVIKALGFQLTWIGTTWATFRCNGIDYEISIPRKTLTESGKSDNYLICAPENTHFICTVTDGVLMVDDNTVSCLFQTFLNYPIRLLLDYDRNCVVIINI